MSLRRWVRVTVVATCSTLAIAPGTADGTCCPVAVTAATVLQEPAADRPAAGGPLTDTDSGNVIVVRPDPAGGMWAGGYGGVLHWTAADSRPALYTVADGLLDNWVFDVAAVEDGTVWVGTASGLSKRSADGAWSDETPPPPNPDDVYQRWAQAVLPTPDGGLWVAMGRGGLHRRTPDGRWQFVALTGLDTGMRDDVRSLALAADGSLWIGGMASGVVQRLAGGTFVPHVHPDLARVFRIALGADGSVWFAGRRGLVHRSPDGSLRTFNPATTGGAMPYIEVRDVAVDRAGAVWIAHVHDWSNRPGGSGLSRYDPATDAWRTFTAADGLPDERVVSVTLDGDGAVWAGTVGGAVRLDPSRLTWQAAALGGEPRVPIPAQFVAQGPDGSVWIAGYDGAAQRRADGTWRVFRSELAHRRVNCITFDADGNVWFATWGGLSRWTPSDESWLHVRRTDLPGKLLSNGIWWVEVDGANHVWAATQGGGVVELTADGQWIATHTYDNTVQSLRSNVAWVVAADDRGSIWVGTEKGLSRRSPTGVWESLVENFPVGAIAFERDDVIWIGGAGSGGARRLSPDGFGTSMPIAGGLRDASVQSIAVDSMQRVWFATRRGIARLWPDGTWDHFDGAQGLASAWSNGVIIDGDAGEAWVATFGGVSRVPITADFVCPPAAPLAPGVPTNGQIDSPRDVERYWFEVAEPYSEVSIRVSDPSDLLTVTATRSCNTIGSGTGRHIGSGTGRHIGAERSLVLPVERSTGRIFLTVETRAVNVSAPLTYSLSVDIRPPDPAQVNVLALSDDAALRLGFAGADNPHGDAQWARLAQAREQLLAAPHVRGRLIDLGAIDEPDFAAARQHWLSGSGTPAAANRYAAAIQHWLQAERERSPSARAVLLIGDDATIPHARLADHPRPGLAGAWTHESDYLSDSGIAADSAIGRALALDLILSDDVYATADPLWVDGQPLAPPSWPVGRIIGLPDDMAGLMTAFAADPASARLDRSLVAGWDFMDDAATAAADALGHLRAPDDHVSLTGAAWDGQRLASLLQGAWPFTFLAMHADHRRLTGPDGQVVDARALAANASPSGAGVALACHSGLHVPDGDDDGGAGDLPEAWLKRAYAFVGSTGWAYGLRGAVGYEERLLVDVTRRLASGADATLGDALVSAKRNYHLTHPLDRFHYKTRVGTILFGLPLVSLRPADTAARPAAPDIAPVRRERRPMDAADARTVAAGARLAAAGGAIAERKEWRLGTTRPQRVDTADGSFYSFSGALPYAEAGQVLQPQIITEVGDLDVDVRRLAPHGIVLVEARYREVPLADPLVPTTGVLGQGTAVQPAGAALARAALSNAASGPWQPPLLATLRTLTTTVAAGVEARAAVDGRALWRFGQYHADRQVERLYHVLIADTFYSDAADHRAPAILGIDVRTAARTTTLTITADDGAAAADGAAPSDAAGVERVVLACDDGRGAWRQVEARRAAGLTWSAVVAASDGCIVHAVDAAGNVGGDADGEPVWVGPAAAQGMAWLPAVIRSAEVVPPGP